MSKTETEIGLQDGTDNFSQFIKRSVTDESDELCYLMTHHPKAVCGHMCVSQYAV